MAIASLDFDSAGSTRRVDHGSDSTLDDLHASSFSAYAKIKRTSNGNNQHVISKDGTAPRGWEFLVDTSSGEGTLRVIIWFATTRLDVTTDASEVALDTWYDVYFDYDPGRSAGDETKIYVGTETTPMVEVASTQDVAPSGAIVSDAGSNLWVGNIQRADTNPFRGQVQKFFVSNVVVPLPEVQGIAWESGTTLLAGVTGGVAADEYDDSGSTQTGLINSTATDGTITGATAVTTSLFTYPVTVDVTDTDLIFSPFNWRSVGGSGTMQSNNILPTGTTAAVSNTPGAYIKMDITTAVGGNGTCSLKLDPSDFASVTIPPQIKVSVNDEPWVTTTLDVNSGVVDISDGGLTANATNRVEVYFKSVDLVDPDDRWTTPDNALVVERVYIDSDASVATFTKRTKDMIVFGDSFSEGATMDGTTSVLASNDSTETWWNYVANALDAEVGVQAFGGAGYIRGINNQAASSTNPALYHATSANKFWDKYSNGQSRLVGGLFVPVPDYIFIMAGRNDSSNIATNLTALIDEVRTAAGTDAWIFVVTDHVNTRASEVVTGVANAAVQTRTVNLVLDTYFTYGTATRYSGDTSHPNSYLSAFMASQITELANAEINKGLSKATIALGV